MEQLNTPEHLQQFPAYVGLQSQDIQIEQQSLTNIGPSTYEQGVSSAMKSLAQEEPKKQPHTYLYVGSVILVLGFIFLYIFCCKWRKDNRGKKKPVKNELIQEKVDYETEKGMKKGNPHQIELGELP